jgi:hypothetical protein
MAEHRAMTVPVTAEIHFEPVELPSRYAKAIVAIVAAVVGVLVAALSDDVVTTYELVGIAIALVTAIGVYGVPNLPTGAGRYGKLFVAIVGTALQALAPLILEGQVTTAGWLMVLLAALGAVGVGIVPNVGMRPLEAEENPVDPKRLYRQDELDV